MSLFESDFLSHPSRRLRWLRHSLFWLLLLGLRFYLTSISFNVYSDFPLATMLLLNVCSTGLIVLFYYMLVYYLAPKYLERRRYFKGALLLLSLLVVYTLFDAIAEKWIITHCPSCMASLAQGQPGYFRLIQTHLSNIVFVRMLTLGTPFFLMLTLSVPISIKVGLNAYRTKIKSVTLEKEKLQLELSFLKAQLNPHFLFNAMNNIYGLIISGDVERSASLIARLSELLRYMLYESEVTTMPLNRELKLMADYVELEKIRLNYVSVDFTMPQVTEACQIAPLLLIPLIENAFKFTNDEPGAYINMIISQKDCTLTVKTENSVSAEKPEHPPGGIGLENMQKRLELYYPGRYLYEVKASKSVYSVNLSVSL